MTLTPKQSSPHAHWRLWAAILTAAVSTSLLLSWAHFRVSITRAREDAEIELESGANLEARLLANWLSERRGDAALIHHSAALQEHLARTIAGSPAERAAAIDLLRQVKLSHDYEAVALYDRNGAAIGGIAGMNDEIPAADHEVLAAMTATNIVFTDLHREEDGIIKTGWMVPVRSADGQPAGLLGLWTQPHASIASSMKEWPTQFKSAELFLIRRGPNGRAELLSPKRLHPGLALCAEIPDVKPDSVIDLAMQGRTGTLHAPGLRGAGLIAHVMGVPGSPWLVMAQVDDAEVVQAARQELVHLSLLTILISSLIGSIGVIVSRQARVKALNRQLELERQQADLEQKYLETEKQFRALFDHSVDGILITGKDGAVFAANPAAGRLLRMTGAEIRRRGRAGLVDPEDPRVLQLIEERNRTGQTYGELRLRRGDGTTVEVEMSSTEFDTPGGKRSGVILRDITARKAQEAEIRRLNQFYAAASEISRATATAPDQAGLFKAVCEALTKHGVFKFVWIGWVDAASQRIEPIAKAGEERDYLKGIDIYADDRPEGAGPGGRCIRENRIVLINDFLSDPTTAPWHDRARAAGVRANACVPLHEYGQVAGVIAAYSAIPNIFGEKEKALLEQAGKDIDTGLHYFTVESARRTTAAALERSERELNEAQRIARMGNWTYDPATDKATWSTHLYEIFQYDRAKQPPSRDEFEELLTPNSRDILRQATKRLYDTGQSYELEMELHRHDGTRSWVWIHGEQPDRNGPVRGVVLDITRRKQAELDLIEAQLFALATLNSLTAHIAILDAEGVILAVNNAWRNFGRANGGDPKQLCEGTNYLTSLTNARGGQPENWHAIRDGIMDVIAGRSANFYFESPCHSPEQKRWFRGRVTRFAGTGRPRAVVAHEDITSIKLSLAILEENERRLRQLAQQSSTVIWEVDHRGLFTYVSEVSATLWGYHPGELMGRKHFYDIHPEEGREEFKAAAFAVFARKESFKNLANPIRCKDGKILWVSTNAIPILNAEGKLTGYRGADTDITEQRAAEEQLRISEERFRKFFQQHSAVMLVAEPGSGRILDANEAAAAFYGWSIEELRAKNVLDINVQRPEVVLPRLQKVTAGQAARYETTHRRADGTIREVEVFLNGIETEGRLAHFVILHDITQRKQAEAERRRLMIAIDQAAEAIVFTDKNGVILYVNQGFEKITGYTRAEAIGQNPRILNSGTQPKEFYRAMWETLRAGEVWQGKFMNRRKDGGTFEEEATISPIFDEAKALVGYVAVKRDVTRESELERQLIEAQKMEAIGQLAGGVAHDYNNILAATIIQLGMLMADPNLSETVREALLDLKRGADRAASLTRQLLLFSRRQAMQKKHFELNALLEDSLKMLRRLIGEHIELIVPARTGDAWIEGDPGMIEQVIMNLCLNARDAMPDGGQLRLAIGTVELDEPTAASHAEARPGKFARLTVADRGTGMTPETLAHIFEPFFTTKGVGKGTGLGLATVHGIAKQHGGWVEVTSEPGKGSEFTVLLPLSERASNADADASPVEIETGEETILIVEDESAVRRPLGQALRRAGFRVFEAENGPEAVKLWHDCPEQIDLLLTDMVMPGGMNGLQLADTLRSIRPQLHVIISSGYSNILNHPAELEQQGFHYITKPYEMTQLSRLIRHCLDNPRRK